MKDQEYRNTLLKYGLGFIISLILTFTSYLLVVTLGLNGMAVMIAIGVLALSQLVVQLIFFLHLSEEKRPRWRTVSFIAMGLILTIIVIGSIWIMYHMNYNMLMFSPEEKTLYILEHGGGF
jgi:cytochrome o ubiquinol oxidase operon protein cyoD